MGKGERKLINALRTLREELEINVAHRQSMMTIRQLEILMRIADADEAVSQVDLVKSTGMSVATISKNVITMGNMWVKDEKGETIDIGMGLVEQKAELLDARKKRITLTEKGRKTVKAFFDNLGQ